MFSSLSFTSPLVLAALAALPAIWFLLRATPPAPKRVRFPAFEILRRLRSSEETPKRTPLPLLLLRLILAALAILGLAGPVLNAPQAATEAGPLALIVDDTWAAAKDWRLRQDVLAAAAEAAARKDRPVFILTTSNPGPGALAGPLTGEEARRMSQAMRPQPLRADRIGAMRRLPELQGALARLGGSPELRWLSDSLGGPGDAEFEAALKPLGDLAVYADSGAIALRALPAAGADRRYRVERLSSAAAWSGAIVATARSGRELARIPASLPAGALARDFSLDLPLALRNEIEAVAIHGVASAGAIQLVDARERRALVGLIKGADGPADDLVSGSYYVRRALEPYAEFVDAPLDELLKSKVSVIVLDDIGQLRAGDADALKNWVESGGVVIRFAGPNLADVAQDQDPPLLPVRLRGGGRAFGGALTWETPQKLSAFSPDGPFFDLPIPEDVFVREQVLAVPGGETSERSWASLADGTPIVTGMKLGSGALVLFHAPATPSWSDLPISSVFVGMLRRLTYLSILGPAREEAAASARLAPFRVLDGFGRFEKPPAEAASIAAAEAVLGSAPGRPPGLYGAPEAPIAVNAFGPADDFSPLALASRIIPYTEEPPARLGAPLLLIALALLLIDGVVTMLYSGKLRLAGGLLGLALLLAPAHEAAAQPVDAPIDPKVAQTALRTRLAYVRTGDPQVDRLSERGLVGLTAELFRRTAIEPAPPVAVDPEADDLSVYPLLYWPVVAGAIAPTEAALANVENFMRFGGLIVFDTRDDERAIGGTITPEQDALREILGQLDIPPLAPLPKDHVLKKSFYLVDDLSGRTRNNPVWVQAQGSANDGVTPLIIGGRDWAAAWAIDDFGRPLRPVNGRGGCSGDPVSVQECAYRAGINIAMVAYTGNYKADQVHTPILLQRLER